MSTPVTPNLTVVDKRPDYCAEDEQITAELHVQPATPQPPVVRAKPIGAKVLLWRIPEPEGPLAIPDVAVEKPLKCKVVAVGNIGRQEITPTVNGPMITQVSDLHVGDEVYIRSWSGTEVKVEGHDLTVILLDDILLRL